MRFAFFLYRYSSPNSRQKYSFNLLYFMQCCIALSCVLLSTWNHYRYVIYTYSWYWIILFFFCLIFNWSGNIFILTLLVLGCRALVQDKQRITCYLEINESFSEKFVLVFWCYMSCVAMNIVSMICCKVCTAAEHLNFIIVVFTTSFQIFPI